MSIKTEVYKLKNITNPTDFKKAVNNILERNIKKNPNTETRMIKSFRKELNNLVEDMINKSEGVIFRDNVIILPTEFSFVFPLTKAIEFIVSNMENKEKTIQNILHVTTLPKYIKEITTKELKDGFYMVVEDKLNEVVETFDLPMADSFRNVDEIQKFTDNDYIQKSINRIGHKIYIIDSKYYDSPCTTDSFPLIHTIYSTGTVMDISKEERFLISIGIMIYNDLSQFDKVDIKTMGFSVSREEDPSEVFAQIFAYYILEKMGLPEKHRFYKNLNRFNMKIFNSDLNFVKEVLNQKSQGAIPTI